MARTLLLAAPWPLAAAPGAARAAAFDLVALMALLATRKSGQARFSEERTVTGFDSPLRSSGTLAFRAPDRFERRTLEPRPETMEVEGNQVVLSRGGRTRRMALDAVPELTALVAAMRGTLTGDGTALTRHFSARVGGDAARWLLTLEPLEATLAQQVRRLQIVGAGIDVRSVELQMTSGDRSLMLIEPIDAAPARPAQAPSAAARAAARPASP